MINIFPEFESRQVLTSDELNWLGCYLDTQNRQSRRFLIGCGLIGGLQVRLVGNTIQVSNGIGLTSAGHIIHLSNSRNGFTSFTKAQPYAAKPKEKIAFHYLSDLDTTQENYAQSVDANSIYSEILNEDVLELFEDTVNNVPAIDVNSVSGKVAVLFAEIIQKELKDCEDDNCQERGKKYVFDTKVLVMSKEAAIKLLNIEYSIQSNNEESISKVAFPWLHLLNLNILKPAFANTSVDKGYDEEVINKEYQRCISDYYQFIKEAKEQIQSALVNLHSYCFGQSQSITFLDEVRKVIEKSGVLKNIDLPTTQFQTIYDYLWVVTKSYQELQLEAQKLKARCFTSESAFPNHILLGVVGAANTEFEVSISRLSSIYRHQFQSRLIQTQQSDSSRKISILIKRLEALGSAFLENYLEKAKDTRITAGDDLYSSLSDQAIPYYLKPTIGGIWNERAGLQNLGTYVTTYDNVNEGLTPSIQYPYASLPSSFQGNHKFFRIEGVHGQIALNALNSVFQIRKKNGLAFEVLMLRVNEKAPFNHSFNYSINEDVESMYNVVRAEVLKQINVNLSYLQSLEIKSDKFSYIEDLLVRQVENYYRQVTIPKFNEILGIAIHDISEAIIANNIYTNYKPGKFTDDPKFEALEINVATYKIASKSIAKREYAEIANIGISTVIPGFIKPGINIYFPIFFFHTLGNLIERVRSNSKFKDSTDINFYSTLLQVAKGIDRGEQQRVLFLHAVQLYCGMKLMQAYLPENFLELDIAKYQDTLEDFLLPGANTLYNYTKALNVQTVVTDEILGDVDTSEMLSSAERVKFDDDWIKIIQIDAENKSRNGGLGVENLLGRFVKLHPGLSHGCGVPKGGTYIMVYDTNNVVMADFYLPYIISSHLRPIQYTLLESKTLTLSGTVKNQAGAPVSNASIKAGNSVSGTDKEGNFNMLVSEKSTIKLIITAEGFKDYNEEIVIESQSLKKDVVLEASAVKTFKTTLTFFNQLTNKVKRDVRLLNVKSNLEEVVPDGSLTLTGATGTEFNYKIKDENFQEKDFGTKIADKDQEEELTVVELNHIMIQLKSQGDFVPVGLEGEVRLSDGTALDSSKLQEGFFMSLQPVDISKTPEVIFTYQGKEYKIPVTPGEDVNIIPIGDTGPLPTKTLKTGIYISYAGAERELPRIKTFMVNGKRMKVQENNVGTIDIVNDGKLSFGKELINVPEILIPENSKGIVVMLNARIKAEKTDVTANQLLHTFTRSLTDAEFKGLVRIFKGFEQLKGDLDPSAENFYCVIMNPDETKRIKELLNV